VSEWVSGTSMFGFCLWLALKAVLTVHRIYIISSYRRENTKTLQQYLLIIPIQKSIISDPNLNVNKITIIFKIYASNYSVQTVLMAWPPYRILMK
jgi:hypothetical protein